MAKLSCTLLVDDDPFNNFANQMLLAFALDNKKFSCLDLLHSEKQIFSNTTENIIKLHCNKALLIG